jgi:hypothetical protein
MTFGRENENQKLAHVWPDQTVPDDSWLDKLWPNSDSFTQAADQHISASPNATDD